MRDVVGRHWHHLEEPEVLDLLDTRADQGLDLFEVGHRRATYGTNALTVEPTHGPFFQFLLQFHQPLVYILIGATVITTILGEWLDASVIFGVVLVNAIIGFFQEARALRAIDALARTMSSEATVIRGGDKQRIPADELV
ncbi:MAG: cation-transporting P-type ATPase, partial [Gammaproteobacteria bacterium]